ncbi:MAG: ribosome maturation factor RimM [Bernardetiaceae bacterium]
MTTEDCFELGVFRKTHGLHGELRLQLETDTPERYQKLDALFLEQRGQLVPYFVERITIQGDQAILKLEEVDSIEAAQLLVGCTVFLPLTALPELEEGEIFLHDLVGFTLSDVRMGTLGKVTEVNELPNNMLLSVRYRGKDILIPFQDALIERLDTTSKQVLMRLPEGLVELYLEEE